MLDAEVAAIEQAIIEDGVERMSYEDMKALAKANLEDEGGLEPVVYLAEGSQIGYLPEGPKEALGW